MEMPNPAPIDSYCTMSPVAPICPYSAPEILYRGHVLAESDFYSIGVMIYEMMTHEVHAALISLHNCHRSSPNVQTECLSSRTRYKSRKARSPKIGSLSLQISS